jgi:hypothetical protein
MIAGALGTIALAGTGWLTYAVWADLQQARAAGTAATGPSDVVASSESKEQALEAIAVGSTFDWIAEDSPDEVIRQAGPYVLTISKRVEDEMTAPIIKVASGSQSVTVEGEMASNSYSHRISVIENRAGAVPVIMVQSFTGGAHCCNHVQLAGFAKRRLKVVDLGRWDGDEIGLPKDISGDGVADFVMTDNRFLYTFASYADSFAPPQILNVVDGEVKDVSKAADFRSLYENEMKQAGGRCSVGTEHEPNGACAAYIASAARLGKLDAAWPRMLAAYNARSDWEFPDGCRVAAAESCPKGMEIRFKSYPEALLFFLKNIGYIPSGWQPPESFQPSDEQRQTDDWTA